MAFPLTSKWRIAMESIAYTVNSVTVLHQEPQIPRDTRTGSRDNPLEVTVVFTDMRSTLEALKTAAGFAEDLDVRVRLVVLQIVPYALPLDVPPVPIELKERQFGSLVSNLMVDTRVDICLCRNKREGLLRALKPHSLVVLGKRKAWWSIESRRLFSLLTRNGHKVVVAKSK
jgi:hypothetical protein